MIDKYPYQNYEDNKRKVFERDNYSCQVCGHSPSLPKVRSIEYCKMCAIQGFLFKPQPNWKPPNPCEFRSKIQKCGDCEFYNVLKLNVPPFECNLPEGLKINFSSPVDLVAHHIDGNKLDSHQENMITVCSSCHRRFHPRKKLLSLDEVKRKVAIEKVKEKRDELFERSYGKCEFCGKTIAEKIMNFKDELPDREKIIKVTFYPNYICYKCNKITPVISLTDDIDYSIMYLQSKCIGTILNERFPFFKKGYTKTVEDAYYANHCINCGTLQGDWFINMEPIEQLLESSCDDNNSLENTDTALIVEDVLHYDCEPLWEEDEDDDELDQVQEYWASKRHKIFHTDGDETNSELKSLKVLCLNCNKLSLNK